MHQYRKKARELALIQLFQIEYQSKEIDHVNEIYAEQHEFSQEIGSYAKVILTGVQTHQENIDSKIQGVAKHWKLDRMSKVDRNVLRIAVFEMLFGEPRLKASIVINEAVDLAKQYGSQDSGGFVNGLLDSLSESERADS